MRGSRRERMLALEDKYQRWIPRTIWEQFESTVRQYPNHEFVVMDNGTRITYSECRTMAIRLAAIFQKFGLQPGENVAIKMTNRPETFYCILALSYCGAVCVSVNAAAGPYELTYVANKIHPRFLVCEGIPEFVQIRHEAKPEKIFVLSDYKDAGKADIDSVSNSCSGIPVVSLKAEMRKPEINLALPIKAFQDPQALAEIMFTSGSTGDPKGVMLGHDQLLRSGFANALNRGFEDGRRILVLVPHYHCFAYVEGFIAGLFVGATLIFISGKFVASETVELIQKEQIHDILLVPYMAERMVESLEYNSTPLPSLHAIYCAGERANSSLWLKIMKLFDIRDVINGYGMTEICGAAIQNVPGDTPEILSAKVGRILPAGSAGTSEFCGRLISYRVVDPLTGKELELGLVGELQCKGLTVMKGYFGDGKATQEAFSPDGWLKTGDLGYFDEDGYLQLQGRIKNSYRINGENVSPEFIEAIIEKSPDIKKAIVVGVPDERLGEVGALFVELKAVDQSNQALDKAKGRVKDFCKRNLARFQVPKYYRFLSGEEWPCTCSGKIQRFKLKEML